ncbi:hypothetical protein BBJ29_006320 [Phytophthora kernoviae]|uniref:G domain-containing protein n=1 Tax=Phytophthora kernoviae TaxID=325452 RepID=A0A3F2RGW0_9STRA|nr:hypothetical protein BBJ29_006320 [Phytophthora kernoviae]RLN56282.1 hypothetical protein BBP00_00008082 [Phytophthora kernoviae]
MQKNFLFLGNPGTGKSTLINCLVGKAVFQSGVCFGGGLTNFFQKHTHNEAVYMDTPGLADRKLKDKAAAAITKALRQTGNYKLFFMVRLESGRVVSDDLATIETVLDSIDMDDIPFSIIVNNVKKRQYTAMMKKGAEFFKVVALINACKYSTPYITFIPTLERLDEMDNEFMQLPREVETFLHHNAPAIVIAPERVKEIKLTDFKMLVDDLKDQLELLRNDNAALRRQLEGLLQKPKFFETLLNVVGTTLLPLAEFAATNAVNLAALLNGDLTAVYMDTPGLADRKLKDKAAAAITKALRQTGNYKLFFMVRLENGRVVADDLATIETVMNSIGVEDVPFSVIVNNVKKRQYKAMMEKGDEYCKVVTMINAINHTTPQILFIPTLPDLDEVDNAVANLPSDIEAFIKFQAPSIAINPADVSEIKPDGFAKLIEELREQLELLRNDNAALRDRMEELKKKPGFFRNLGEDIDNTVGSFVHKLTGWFR